MRYLDKPERRYAARRLLVAVLAWAGTLSLALGQSGSETNLSVPMFFEAHLQAEDVAALLGPSLSAVSSLVVIEARGSGRATLRGPAQIEDGEQVEVDAFFDITYRIDFTDTDPENDYAPSFLTSPGTITVRLPRSQSSRIESSGTCSADTTSPNFGCLPQLLDNLDISWQRGNRLPLSQQADLMVADSNLASSFLEQVPLGGNQIFTDGFESGDVSAFGLEVIFDAASGESALQPRTPANQFTLATSGTIEIQEKVVVPGSQLVNHFSLVGQGSAGDVGFQTTMIFTNTGGPSDLHIEFFTPSGEPLAVVLSGEAAAMTTFETTLAQGQALSLQTADDGDLQVGYARFNAGPAVGATAVLTRSDMPSGATLYDAGVPAVARPLRRFSIFVDSLGSKDTGLAMVRAGQNSADASAQGSSDNVRLHLFDTDFNPVATTSFPLPEGAQISRFIWEYFQDQPEVAAQAREMQGVAVVEADHLLAAITLRLTDDAQNPTLTAFPVIEGRAEASMMQALEKR